MYNIEEYKNILIFLVFCFIIASAIFLVSLWLIKQKPYTEKIAAYECGFHPFLETQTNFNIQFYLIAILFIIFDLEIIFLFPWVIILHSLNFFGFWSMFFFLGLLFFGFFFEWYKGALEWN